MSERKIKANCQVQVQLRPDPDKNAIAIDMNHGNGWFHISYIVSEHTGLLHPPSEIEKIVHVTVHCIIFSVFFLGKNGI